MHLVLIPIGTDTMSSLEELQQRKIDLDLKIAQSLKVVQRLALDLTQAQIQLVEINSDLNQIKALIQQNRLSQNDFSAATACGDAAETLSPESKTLSEMRQYFNRR